MEGEEIFIVHLLLDEQICDAEGRRVGRVDDVELSGDPRLARRLSGRPRRPLAPVARARHAWVKVIPWGAVVSLEHERLVVRL